MKKEELLKALRHEIAICDKLNAQYKEERREEERKGNEVGASVFDDLQIQTMGEKYGLKTAIKYIESILED